MIHVDYGYKEVLWKSEIDAIDLEYPIPLCIVNSAAVTNASFAHASSARLKPGTYCRIPHFDGYAYIALSPTCL